MENTVKTKGLHVGINRVYNNHGAMHCIDYLLDVISDSPNECIEKEVCYEWLYYLSDKITKLKNG